MNQPSNSSDASTQSTPAPIGPSAATSPISSLPTPQPSMPQPPTPQQTGRRILVNTGALAGSSLWRIAISFVLQLMIARQLGVVSLGQYTIALAYLNVCQIISELGLPALLVRDLAQHPWLRRSYFRLALSIQSVAAIVTWGGLIGMTVLLPLAPATRLLLWIVGASLPFYAVTSVCQILFQSGERMEYVMGVELFVNTLILVLSLVVILGGGSTWQLIAVLVITQLVSALLSLLLLWRSQLFAGEQKPVAWQWSMLWRRSSPFFGLAVADVLLQRADIVLLSIFGGEVITGIYGAAYNLLRVALKLIQNFWVALYPTLSRLFHQQPAHYRRLAHFGLHYGLLAILVTAAIGTGITPEVLHIIYGEGYGESARVLQVLLWMAPFYLLENYTQTLLMVERKPLQSLWITGLHLLALIILLPFLTTVSFSPLVDGLTTGSTTASSADSMASMGNAVLAALAALIAGSIGALSSIRLLYRWSLPGRLQRPWLVITMTVLLTGLSYFLPIMWLWRMLFSIVAFVLFSWFGGLIAVKDGQLLRRVLRGE